MKDGAVTLTSTLRAPPRMQQRHRAGSSPEEKKKGQQLTTLQEQAQAVESRIRELASSNATLSAAAGGPLSAIAAALPVALAVTREPSFSSKVTSSGSSTAAAIVAVALAT